MPAHHAAAIAEVLQEVVRPANASFVATFFLEQRHVSKRSARFTTGLRRTHAGFKVLPFQLRQMEREFLIEFVVEPILAYQRLDTLLADAKETREGHGV